MNYKRPIADFAALKIAEPLAARSTPASYYEQNRPPYLIAANTVVLQLEFSEHVLAPPAGTVDVFLLADE